jgi:hypothetical protein
MKILLLVFACLLGIAAAATAPETTCIRLLKPLVAPRLTLQQARQPKMDLAEPELGRKLVRIFYQPMAFEWSSPPLLRTEQFDRLIARPFSRGQIVAHSKKELEQKTSYDIARILHHRLMRLRGLIRVQIPKGTGQEAMLEIVSISIYNKRFEPLPPRRLGLGQITLILSEDGPRSTTAVYSDGELYQVPLIPAIRMEVRLQSLQDRTPDGEPVLPWIPYH